MYRIPDTPVCERGNDLIAYLYGEIDERAGRDFKQHLLNCAECESQLGAFKQIRSSVVAWRQESLLGGAANSVSRAVGSASDSGKRSAMADIRQFFELSPLWMKGSIAFASVVFCLVSVIALAHFFENPKPVVAGDEKRYSEKDLQAKIDEAVKSGMKDREVREPAPPPSIVVNNNARDKVQIRVSKQSSEPAGANPKVRRGPLTKSEREQLAADLRLIAPQDETDLDLLGDGNNQ
jgi:hypothetical protein